MRILTPGRAADWSAKLTCTGEGNVGSGCGALLLVEVRDVYMTEANRRDETDYFATFRCMSCLVETDIPDYPHMVDLLRKADASNS